MAPVNIGAIKLAMSLSLKLGLNPLLNPVRSKIVNAVLIQIAFVTGNVSMDSVTRGVITPLQTCRLTMRPNLTLILRLLRPNR